MSSPDSDRPDIQAWQSKLQGKLYIRPDAVHAAAESDKGFKREELPKNTRVLTEGEPRTLDFRPERLNVYLDAEGRCTHCDAC